MDVNYEFLARASTYILSYQEIKDIVFALKTSFDYDDLPKILQDYLRCWEDFLVDEL